MNSAAGAVVVLRIGLYLAQPIAARGDLQTVGDRGVPLDEVRRRLDHERGHGGSVAFAPRTQVRSGCVVDWWAVLIAIRSDQEDDGSGHDRSDHRCRARDVRPAAALAFSLAVGRHDGASTSRVRLRLGGAE